MHSRCVSAFAVFVCASLTACHQAEEADLTKAAQCVDIPDGQYFQFVDGKLVTVTAVKEEEREQPIISAQRIGRSLAGQGFPWLTINWDGQTATIGGIAPDEASRIDGFRNAKDAFEKDPVTGDTILRVVNNIEVRFEGVDVADRLNELFATTGYSWLRAEVKGNVAILTGTAPDLATKKEAYRAAQTAVNIELNSDETAFIAVDAISARGEEEPVGEALLTLNEQPGLIDCDNALFETMDDQAIAFVDGESIVDNSSKPLMDALTGIASLCREFEIEVRQHSGGEPDGIDAMSLSERRASAIRDLLSIGGDRDAIVARGFGTSSPLDSSGTPAARARNERTEFIVRERAD